jgi:hypothetical protein
MDHGNLPLAAGAVMLSMGLTAAPLVRLLAGRQPGDFGDVRLADLITDQLSLLVALAGVLLARAGYPAADPIAAIALAPIIIANGVGFFRQHAGILLRRSPGSAFLRHDPVSAPATTHPRPPRPRGARLARFARKSHRPSGHFRQPASQALLGS